MKAWSSSNNDADPDCHDQIRENAGPRLSEFHVFPYFLGPRAGRSVIHINYDPYTSTSGVLNPRYAGFYMAVKDHDYVIGEVFKTLETREIEVVTLDQVLTAKQQSIPPPDFLSVDVVGLGYDVFLGAGATLASHVLGVVDSVFFHRIHLGQKTLHDHCELLDPLGFDFVGFKSLLEYSSHRAPVGQRGKGHLLGVDAVFLRRAETLATMFPDHDERYPKCCKLAFIAIRLGYVEFALYLLDEARRLEPCDDVLKKVAATSYGRFLENLGRAAAAMPRRFPPTFNELYTPEQSLYRFVPSGAIAHGGLKGWLKTRLLPHPRLLGAVRQLRRAVGAARAGIRAFIRALASLMPPRYSAFERVLANHGLVDVAELVRDKRLQFQPVTKP